MRERGDDGVPRVQHLEAAAKRGSVHAIKALTPPPFPDALGYLYGWALALVGRSGASMEGPAPLSYATIDAWARLTDEAPSPEDVNALLVLDTVMRHPDTTTED